MALTDYNKTDEKAQRNPDEPVQSLQSRGD